VAAVRLPRLRSDLAVKREVVNQSVVVLLSAPGAPARRVTERVYRALEVLDLYEDAASWAVGVGDPELTPARLQQLVGLLEQGGLVEARGDTKADVIVMDKAGSAPTPDVLGSAADELFHVDEFPDDPQAQAVAPFEYEPAQFDLNDSTMEISALPQQTALARAEPRQLPVPVQQPEPEPPEAQGGMVADPMQEVEVSVSMVRASPEAAQATSPRQARGRGRRARRARGWHDARRVVSHRELGGGAAAA
jgi:hypothetical protein